MSESITFGPPVRYRPVCRRTEYGFVGGPERYERMRDGEEWCGVRIVETTEDTESEEDER